MKKQLIILIIYLGILMSTTFVDIPYSNSIVIVLTVLFFGYLIYEFNNIANTKIEGDLILRRQTKMVRPLFILLALIPSVSYFINNRINFLQILLFWSVVIFDIVISIFTKRLKPIGMVIKEKKLILNDFRNTNRNLSQLKSMKLNGLTDEIEMTFVNEKRLYINRSEYLAIDIESLISICIDASQEQLSISDNLKNGNNGR
ncbi:hypothetical protein [Limnovirga soli]|uniref:Uncharacterized protein n=1 Tax=Limnovirga soli TaxID=2656915 RepID=A0A8J8FCG3_9BACT|nr:hypothetical protein [Limnovirga soli]NNV53819.1 hypothetical protein [Limnovirga soli]